MDSNHSLKSINYIRTSHANNFFDLSRPHLGDSSRVSFLIIQPTPRSSGKEKRYVGYYSYVLATWIFLSLYYPLRLAGDHFPQSLKHLRKLLRLVTKTDSSLVSKPAISQQSLLLVLPTKIQAEICGLLFRMMTQSGLSNGFPIHQSLLMTRHLSDTAAGGRKACHGKARSQNGHLPIALTVVDISLTCKSL